jgi:hypothetical protein
LVDSAAFKVASNGLGGTLHHQDALTIIAILHRALARAELAAPVAAQGSFIPVGGSFTAVASVSKILGSATSSILIVDPYADANLLTEFAVLAPEGVRLMILADEAHHKPALKPTAKSWARQYGQARPMEVRLAPAKSLHDRIIVVDNRDAWTLGQSFNALATRSPTSIVRVDPETARMKVDAYNSTWAAATALPA